ncbi:hypothetical protein A2415_02720 [candidate division WWE3 bacterium RIFOXYC1_FULL_39_7]|uniref:DUF2029 domain-containing protein n=2 Tax=Katanobacteria TaxID=422282 RepID=A0A1F4X4J5_UNCKA|nr:MAG: hypothetical protein A2415_02720 [candidate division WWE3 bacterium RIFOXYC1_FULL_39_7]OGC76634.1 MAG: hypothetical protein A2619_04260 [candidate division WWE3 bacterium RIFOXYD1_FULL_39_9]
MFKFLDRLTPRQLILNGIFFISLAVISAYVLLHSTADLYQTDARVYYVAGKLLASGQISNIYNREFQDKLHQELVGRIQPATYFINLPAVVLFFAPFTFLSFEDFYNLLVVLNTLLIGFTVHLLCQKLKINNIVTSALIFYIPVASAIWHSQVTVIIFLIFAFAILNIKNPFVSGLFAGALFLKPQYLLFAPLLFFVVRSWDSRIKYLLGFASTFLVILITNLVLYGPYVYQDYLQFLNNRDRNLVQMEMYQGYNVYSIALFLDPIFGYKSTFTLIFILQLVLYLSALILINKKVYLGNVHEAISAAVIFSLVLNFHTKYTDLLILVIPVLLLLGLYAKNIFADYKDRAANVLPAKHLIVTSIILCVPVICFLANYILGFLLLASCGFWLLLHGPTKSGTGSKIRQHT